MPQREPSNKPTGSQQEKERRVELRRCGHDVYDFRHPAPGVTGFAWSEIDPALPSGRSASWEFGYAMGAGKRGAVVMFEPCEPELMYAEAEILTTPDDLFNAFGAHGVSLEDAYNEARHG